MLLYPMIDDRSTNWTDVPKDQVTWNVTNNVLAWHLYLKGLRTRKNMTFRPMACLLGPLICLECRRWRDLSKPRY
jgi:hypothetical protein